MRNINIRNVHGAFRLFAVSFTHHYPLHEDKPVLLENIHLSDLYVSKSTGYAPEDQIPAVINNSLVWFESGTNCRNITVERVYRHEKNEMTKAPSIRISRGAAVSDITISDIHQDFVGDPQPILSNESTSEIRTDSRTPVLLKPVLESRNNPGRNAIRLTQSLENTITVHWWRIYLLYTLQNMNGM